MTTDKRLPKYAVGKATVSQTYIEETSVLIGILIQSDVKKDSKLNMDEIWSPQHGNPLCLSATSKKLFDFRIRRMRLNNTACRHVNCVQSTIRWRLSRIYGNLLLTIVRRTAF